MKPESFVKLLVAQDHNPPKRGTGYRIAPHLVLTAAHVLGGAEEAELWLDGEERPKTGTRIWQVQEGDLDAAILEHDPVGLAPVARPFFAARLLATPHDWCSLGWAAAGKDAPTVEDPLDGIEGRAYPSSRNASRFEVTVGLAPKAKRRPGAQGGKIVPGWAGISGAPVFVGLSIYGIVRKLKKDFPDRLIATSMVALREIPEFRKLTGLDRREKQSQQRARKAIRRLLDEALVAFLAEELRQITHKNPDEAAAMFCTSESLPEVARALDRAHARACEEGAPDGFAERLEEIAAWVGPSVFFATQTVGATPDGEPLREELAVAFPHLVELTLAGADGKPYSFEPTQERRAFPLPKFQLPLPSECGITATGEEGFDNFLDHLKKELGFDPKAWDSFGENREQRIRFFNQEIAGDAASLRGRRSYLAVGPRHRRDEGDTLLLIEQHLRELHIIHMVGEPTAEEYEAFQALRDLLFRAEERRHSS